MNEAPLSKLLSNVVDNRGRTCPVVEQGFPLIATNCVKSDHLYPVFEKLRFVDEETYSNWFRAHPLPGDLIFVLKGSPGEVCLTPDPVPFCIAQDMVALRADPKKIKPSYLFAFLRSQMAKDAILNMHVGTMIPHFKKGDFDKLMVPLPAEATQEFIGNWYLTISRKIELNRRMNETLEALAQAIFKDWFVDFGPTRRKMEGATDPIAILGGLIPDPAKAAPLAALFPDSFGENGLPKGWEETTLDAVCTVNNESWKASNHPDEVNYVDLSNTKWGLIESTSIVAWKDAPSRARRIARPGDTIVGTVRPGNGSFAFISDEGYTASTGFAVLRPKQPEYASLVYIASTRPENIERLANIADSHGGAYPAVNPGEVTSTQFSHPGDPILLAFNQLVGPFRDRIEHNKNENRTLAETRDYLLPKLMSGAVLVRDAAAMTE